MLNTIIKVFLFAFLALELVRPCFAEKKDNLNQLKTMNSKNYKQKNEIVTSLMGENFTLEEKKLLLDDFGKEVNFKEEFIKNKIREGLSKKGARKAFKKEYLYNNYASYMSGYAKLISSLKMPESAGSLVLGLKDYGGTEYTPKLLIDIGEQAIEPVLTLANSEDDSIRSNAYFVLSIWVNAPVITEHYAINSDSKIKEDRHLKALRSIFLKGLNDKFIDVRLRSLYGLRAFPDRNVIKEIKRVANNDSYFESSIGIYPIRENAKIVLEDLQGSN
jgi:hypothetical protein